MPAPFPSLASLGIGALLAWAALPLLAWLARSRVRSDAASAHRAQLAALGCAALLLCVPSLSDTAPALRGGAALWWLLPDGWRPSAPYYALELHTTIVRLAGEGPRHERGLSASLSLGTLLGAGWALAVAFGALRAARGWFALRSVVADAERAPAELTALLHARAAALPVRAPALRVAHGCAIPFVFGLARPVLVLPHELACTLDRDSLALVLDHELEHLRRGDLRMAALVTVLQVALGGHPSARMLAREAMLAREVAVDARVAQLDRRAYASLLVEIAAHAQLGERLPATAIDDTALARRIALIAEPGPAQPRSSAPVYAAAALIAALACYARGVVDGSPFPGELLPPPPGRAFGIGHGVTIGGFAHGPTRVFMHKPGSPFDAPAPPPPFAPSLPLVLSHSPAVRACYQRAAAGDPTLALAATFELELSTRGTVAAARVQVPERPELEPCLSEAALRLPPSPEHALPPLGNGERARITLGLLLGPDLPVGPPPRTLDTFKLAP